jgi:RNase P subunit RPR2
MQKLSKEEARKEVLNFFKSLEDKTPKEIKRIKKLAMHYNIKLKEQRKKFCKKCYSTNLRFKKIKKGVKTVICGNCGYICRWKIKD